MTPFDVVATRMFNQKHGLYYDGLWDCIKKMYRHEGVLGFYKGTFAHFFRIGPHSLLTLIIWDRYRKWFL
jgi:solute carrier family 25 protein 34/35